MTLELNGRKVVVIGGTRDLGRTIGEAVSNKGTNMVIWISEWKGDVNELKQLLPRMELRSAIVSQQQANGTSRHGVSRWVHTNHTGRTGALGLGVLLPILLS